MHALHKIAVGESSVSRMNVVASTSRAYANQVEGERGADENDRVISYALGLA